MWAVSFGYRLRYKCEKVRFAHLFLKMARAIMGKKELRTGWNK